MELPDLAKWDWPSIASLALASDVLVAAAVSAAATLGLAYALAPRMASRPAAIASGGIDGSALEFLINGSTVKAATPAARALLETLGPGGSRLAALGEHLARECPSVQKDLEELVLYGTAFRHHVSRRDGSAYELCGQPRGAAAVVRIRPASEDARARRAAELALERTRKEIFFLRDVIDRAPVLAWSVAPDNTVAWANSAFRERFDEPAEDLPDHRIANAFGHVLDEVPLTQGSNGASRRRVAVTLPADGSAHWFEISQTRARAGETIGYAVDADELVAAEASLRRFVETLTETFAHLPIGLAVFDKNRRLGLFNPALTDLVKIDAVWLAGRPSLRDFLERLRETRQMPEQKDFTAWRRKLGELEEGAREGTYEENWVLPSGKIFRVTGRPHPQGALAFLFEDISSNIMLERRYRAELELSQATLDRMVEAVAVFDTSGMLVFVNSAFEAMWGTDPMETLEGPGVGMMTALWQGRCLPSPAWAELRDFATGAETRTRWTADLETVDSRPLHMVVAPLPNGSTLVVFRDLSEERERLAEARSRLAAAAGSLAEAAVVGELALEQLRSPAEAAVKSLMAAIPSAPTPEAFQSLSAAAATLKDALARARDLQALTQAGGAQPALDPVGALGRLLRARGLALVDTSAAAELPTSPIFARALACLGLALADYAAPGATVSLSLDGGDDFLHVELSAEADPAATPEGAPDRLGVGLARRILTHLDARPEFTRSGDHVRIRASLPRAQFAAPLELHQARNRALPARA